ncbi:MAG: putative amino acid-binding ACT domain protein [Candidatus Binatia bacterium]|jgi:predicted amino acid-binding ACT domain protein
MQMKIEGWLNDADGSLLLKVSGEDRPNIIAEVAGKLEEQRLYVASITFGLTLPSQDRFAMDVLAKGDRANLLSVKSSVERGALVADSSAAASPQRRIDWPTAHIFHLSLYTPDQEGLTARLSRIVGQSRETKDFNICPNGSFVHLLGITHNAGGAQGATPYYSLRANVATESLAIQEQIIEDLHRYAEDEGFGNDLWTRDLNKGR